MQHNSPKNKHTTQLHFSQVCSTKKYDDGMIILSVPVPSARSLTVLALVNTGSRYEESKISGISHVLEHMVFKGTTSFPTAFALSSALDAVGAEYNAFTSKEYTGYYVKSASKDLPLAVQVVSEMLTAPLLRDEDLEREKGVIVEEMNMYADTPRRHIGDVFEQIFFEGTALEPDVIGTKETVRSLSADDLRAYLRQWYGPANTVVIISGDDEVVSKKETITFVREQFTKHVHASQNEHQKHQEKRERSFVSQDIRGTKPYMKVVSKKTDQAHFIIAVPGICHGDDRRYAAAVLSTLFGGTMSSRLFTEVREKRGLCYYVHSVLDSYHDLGMFGVWAGVDPARIEEAIRVVREELFALVSNGPRKITEKEVQTAKDNLIGTTILDLEDTQSLAHFYGLKQLLRNEIEEPDVVLRKLSEVTVEEVRSLAHDLLDEKALCGAMIGPFTKQDEKKFLQMIS